MSEEWKPAPNAPGYDVSNLGNVRSWRKCGGGARVTPRPVRLHRDHGGYLRLGARVGGRTTRPRVHRWVLEAFVGPCPEGMEACHANGARDDNRLANLRWDTRAANAADRERHGTFFRPCQKLTREAVASIRERAAAGEPQAALAADFGVGQPTISKIVNRRRWVAEVSP